jgi:hypothetical protein
MVVPVAVPKSVIAIPVTKAVVTITQVTLQVFAIPGQPAFVVTDFAPILADVAIAEAVVTITQVTITQVTLQVFAIPSQPAFVVTDFAPILADVAIQPARALGHFVRAHSLQPVDSLGQVLTVDPLLRPAADDLPQTIAERRIAREARDARVWQKLA